MHSDFQLLWNKINSIPPDVKISKYMDLILQHNSLSALFNVRDHRSLIPHSNLLKNLLRKLVSQKFLCEVPGYALTRFLSLVVKHHDLLRVHLREQIELYSSQNIHFGSSYFLHTFNHGGKKQNFLLEGSTALPLASCVDSEPIRAAYNLLDEWKKLKLNRNDRDCVLIASSDFDNRSLIADLWDRYRLKPIIPIGMEEKLGETIESKAHIPVYKDCYANELGEVFCPQNQRMVFSGFEKKRLACKFRCIHTHYGASCKHRNGCSVPRSIRVSLKLNRRLFTPIPRNSYKWVHHFKQKDKIDNFEVYFRNFLERSRRYTDHKKDTLWVLDQILLYHSLIS